MSAPDLSALEALAIEMTVMLTAISAAANKIEILRKED